MSARAVLSVFKRELRGYFATPVGPVFLVLYLLVSNFFFFFVDDFFRANQASMRAWFAMIPWMFLGFVPAIGMRLWAEERRTGTLELLLTLPLREVEAVLGKFLAGTAFLGVALACSITVPLTVGLVGRPDWGVIAASYAGALLLGAAYLAVSLWVSSLTENQVTALVGSVAALFALLAVGYVPTYLRSLGLLAAVCDHLSLLTHFRSIARGVLDTQDLLYYASVIAFFLYLNVKTLESRKWS